MTTTGNQGLDALAGAVAKVVIDEIRAELRQQDEVLDINGAAKYLKISAKSVRRLIQAGDLPVARIRGTIRIDSRDLRKLMEASKEATVL